MQTLIEHTQATDLLSASALPSCDYVINPYGGCTHGCIYCYADFMKRFNGHTEPWGSYLDVKECTKPLSVKKLTGHKVFLSSVTDPYLPFERRYRKTEAVLRQLSQIDTTIGILTKGDAVTRDIDLLKSCKDVEVAFSINTLDDSFRRIEEPGAASITRRINAMKTIHDAGLPTAVFISPIFPGITDVKAILHELKDVADSFWFENLNLRGSARPRVLHMIAEHFPHLVPLYHEIYDHKDRSYWEEMAQMIPIWCKEEGINNYINYFYHEEIRKNPKKKH